MARSLFRFGRAPPDLAELGPELVDDVEAFGRANELDLDPIAFPIHHTTSPTIILPFGEDVER